jgi:hypothetical protein
VDVAPLIRFSTETLQWFEGLGAFMLMLPRKTEVLVVSRGP